MILVVDVGNTNVVLGIYNGTKLEASWRMTTSKTGTSDETGMFITSLLKNSDIDKKKIDGVIISSVVPDIMYSFRNGIKKYFGIEPLMVGPGIKTGINIRAENPKEVGSDRLVNAVASYELYGGGIIVIDYGTATKYDVISRQGEFVAGITAPGIRICANALFEKAALLSKVEIEMPKSILAKNTTHSIQAGIVFGHIGETEYIVNKIKSELNDYTLKVVATGGLSKIIAQGTKCFDVINPMLTLEGLRILYYKNNITTV